MLTSHSFIRHKNSAQPLAENRWITERRLPYWVFFQNINYTFESNYNISCSFKYPPLEFLPVVSVNARMFLAEYLFDNSDYLNLFHGNHIKIFAAPHNNPSNNRRNNNPKNVERILLKKRVINKLSFGSSRFLQKNRNYSKTFRAFLRVYWALSAAPILAIFGLFPINLVN